MQHLGDAVEADVGVARLDLAQGVTGDARSLGDLLRGQAEHHAPPAHVLSELLHLTVDPVARHAPPFTMTTIVAQTESCGDVARRMVQRPWSGQRLRQLRIVPQTPGPLASGLFKSSSGTSSAHNRKRAADPRRQDGPSHSAYGQTDGYQAAT